jgi:hypothetical protein
MNKNDGRFRKGEHRSPSTQFKPGEHWRPKKPYWEKVWLENEYLVKQRSAPDIATDWNVQPSAIEFWLRKHDIPRRSISEARAVKHWGLAGSKNGMFGKTGEGSPNWKGGITPERQTVYRTEEWKDAVRFVWDRDKGQCQRCLKKQPKQYRKSFHIHHRISFDVADLRTNVDNLVLLCHQCHGWVHGKENIHRLFLGSFQASLVGGEE